MSKTVKELEKEVEDLKRRVERVESERVIFIPYPYPQPYLQPQPIPVWPTWGVPWWQTPVISNGSADAPITTKSHDAFGTVTWTSNRPYVAEDTPRTTGYWDADSPNRT